MLTPTSDRETILQTIESWPLEEQVLLAQAILRRAHRDENVPQQPSWREMAGLAATGQTPPSDDDVARLLREHRLEKYG